MLGLAISIWQAILGGSLGGGSSSDGTPIGLLLSLTKSSSASNDLELFGDESGTLLMWGDESGNLLLWGDGG